MLARSCSRIPRLKPRAIAPCAHERARARTCASRAAAQLVPVPASADKPPALPSDPIAWKSLLHLLLCGCGCALCKYRSACEAPPQHLKPGPWRCRRARAADAAHPPGAATCHLCHLGRCGSCACASRLEPRRPPASQRRVDRLSFDHRAPVSKVWPAVGFDPLQLRCECSSGLYWRSPRSVRIFPALKLLGRATLGRRDSNPTAVLPAPQHGFLAFLIAVEQLERDAGRDGPHAALRRCSMSWAPRNSV
jgi:hypothetical protein